LSIIFALGLPFATAAWSWLAGVTGVWVGFPGVAGIAFVATTFVFAGAGAVLYFFFVAQGGLGGLGHACVQIADRNLIANVVGAYGFAQLRLAGDLVVTHLGDHIAGLQTGFLGWATGYYFFYAGATVAIRTGNNSEQGKSPVAGIGNGFDLIDGFRRHIVNNYGVILVAGVFYGRYEAIVDVDLAPVDGNCGG